jgi:hypothetical protein
MSREDLVEAFESGRNTRRDLDIGRGEGRGRSDTVDDDHRQHHDRDVRADTGARRFRPARAALMRRSGLFLVAVTCACMASTSSAGADRPSTVMDSVVSVECPSLTEPDGVAELWLYSSDDGSSTAFAALFAPDGHPWADEPLLTPSPAGDPEVSVTEGSFSAVTPMETTGGDPEPAGSATAIGTLTPVGDPQLHEGRHRDGNRWVTYSHMVQELDVAGTLTFSDTGAEFDLAGCRAFTRQGTERQTNPNAYTVGWRDTFLSCELDDGAGTQVLLFADAAGPILDVIVHLSDGSLVVTDLSTAPLPAVDASGVSGSAPLVDEAGDPWGDATISATFTSLGSRSFRTVGQTSKDKVTERMLAVDGQLEIDPLDGDPIAFDLSDCAAGDVRGRFIQTNPAGPKPTGNAPGNDTPEGAVRLTPGDHLNVQTGGTAVDPEAGSGECPPIGHSLWYSVEGTGDTIVVDTTGSHFDTVVAAYVDDGGALVEVACVDDVFDEATGFSLQSQLTLQTEPGTTYLVQVGGFGYEFGLLKLSVT